MSVLLIIMSAFFALAARLERNASFTQARINATAQARSALDLMANEIELAGSNPTVDTVITSAVGPCASACTINVASGAGIIVGDMVSVGTLSDYESVQVVSVGNGSFTAVLTYAHAVGEPVVYPGYAYAAGVCPENSAGVTGCSSTELQFFGDILGDNKLYFVQYVYNSSSKQLTRSITAMTAASKATAYVLCDNVVAATFTLRPDAEGNNSSLSISLTVQTPYPDPQTGQYAQTVLERGMIQARNVGLASLMQANHDGSNVPPTPTGINTFVP